MLNIHLNTLQPEIATNGILGGGTRKSLSGKWLLFYYLSLKATLKTIFLINKNQAYLCKEVGLWV